MALPVEGCRLLARAREHVVDVDMLGLQKGENGYSYSIYVAFDQGLYNARFQTMPGSEAKK